MRRLSVAAGLCVALLAGCTSDASQVETHTSTAATNSTTSVAPADGSFADQVAPDPVLGYVDGPLAAWDKRLQGGAEAALIEGPLELVDNCLLVGGSAVLWRHGTVWDENTQHVVFADGSQVSLGGQVSSGGGYYAADSLSFFTDVPAVLEWAERCARGREIAVVQ